MRNRGGGGDPHNLECRSRKTVSLHFCRGVGRSEAGIGDLGWSTRMASHPTAKLYWRRVIVW